MDSAQVANGVFVAARPVPVRVTPGRTAVVVVDMQNDFGSIGGMFEQAGVDISEIRAMIPTISALISGARRAGMKIVCLKMAFRADLSDAGRPDSPNWLKHVPLKAGEHVVAPTGAASRVLVRDTRSEERV